MNDKSKFELIQEIKSQLEALIYTESNQALVVKCVDFLNASYATIEIPEIEKEYKRHMDQKVGRVTSILLNLKQGYIEPPKIEDIAIVEEDVLLKPVKQYDELNVQI